MQNDRRNPDAFLALYRQEQDEKTQGRLKVFFGYAPGVGKTYAMLEDARKLKKEGVDVVVGIVETHGRSATKALLEGLEEVRPRTIDYKGTFLQELDLDAALTRKPQVILVDEAAHTNAHGSRHEKRWQDIQELLANGIDVFTTLNTQHIESLNDRVAQITNIEVRERVPDSFVEKAFEIELVDLPVDELLQRLREGKVYIKERAATAMEHFFRKGNLIALREIALLFVAQRVDAQMERYRETHRIGSIWPAAEKILVCVSPSPLSIKLVRGAKRMATALRANWIVAYVETPQQASLPDADKARVIQTLRLAEQLGAEIVELVGERASEEIIKCANQYNASKIVIGKPARPRWKEILFGSVVDDIIRNSGAIDVYVITGDEDGVPSPVVPFVWRRSTGISAYWKSCFVVAGCSGLAYLMSQYLEPTNLVMIYLLGVFFIALKLGRGPSILAAVVSVAVFDYCFVPPYLTFAVSDSQYVLTFFVMLMVALSISTLASRVKLQAELSNSKEKRTAALYSMSKELASIDEPLGLLRSGALHLAEVFMAKVAILIPDESGKLSPIDAGGGEQMKEVDVAVAQWVYHNRQMAGLGTNTLPGTNALYLPMAASGRTIGVVGLMPDTLDKFSRPEQLQLLQTFVNQLTQACERAYLSEENERAHVQMKTEQLRSSLLSSVSHDLRTPLATITGAASSIMEAPDSLSLSACKERAEEIYLESVRLNRLVTNLLEMTKLQAGTLKVKKEWCPIEEIIGAALNCLDERLTKRPLKIDLPEDTALVPVDVTLVQQVLVNLLENALKYSPEETPIAISATRSQDAFVVSVADQGVGVSDEHKLQIFQKFFRENPQSTFGAGLGLAICSGIVEAHGGKIWVEDNPGGGSIFRFELPIESNEPPVLDPEKMAE